MLRWFLSISRGVTFVLALLFVAPIAGAGPLEVILCAEADLINDTCAAAERLTAGATGFAVSVGSGLRSNALVSLLWTKDTSAADAEALGEEMIVVAGGKRKLAAFHAQPGGLVAGAYRLHFSIAGQQVETLPFEVVEGMTAAHQGTASTKGETVSDALGRVFATKRGPEVASEGIAVIGEFFDKELGGTVSQTASQTATQTHPDARTAGVEGRGQVQAPATATTQAEPAADAMPSRMPPAAGASPAIVNGAVDAGGLQLVCARALDADKAPVEVPEVFDAEDPAIHLAVRATRAGLPDLVRVEWQALNVEGLPSGRRMTDTSVVLRQGAWRSATFKAPEGGFWPGTYKVLVTTRDGAFVAETAFEIASLIEPALLLDQMDLGARNATAGVNIALAALGATVVSATSEAGGSAWNKDALIDGFGYGGEDCKPSCGWASADRRLPQELVFAFRDLRTARLKGVVLDAESCSGDERCLQGLPRVVELWASTTAPDAGFEQLATRRLRPLATRHYVPLPGVEARYLKLVIRSNYGSSRRTQLAEVGILEDTTAESIVADLPLDLALPAFGGTVLRYTSAHYRGEAARLLRRFDDGKGWRSEGGELPQELTFCLRDDAEALIDHLELDLDSKLDPASRPREIAVALSSTSPVAGFVEAARVRVPPGAGTLSIPLDRRARFIRLRLLENGGGAYTSLGKVAIIEGRAPGYVPLLARPADPYSDHQVEQAQADPVPVTAEVEPGLSAELAPLLLLGERIRAAFGREAQIHYYALELAGLEKGVLNLELIGLPFLRTRLRLLDGQGAEVASFNPTRSAGSERHISWQLDPGRYLLEASITPADIVLAWDVSRSMAPHTDLLRQAVTGFIQQVGSGEAIALIAFNDEVHVLVDEFTSDRNTLLKAVEGSFKAEMATRLYDAAEAGIKLLNMREGAGVLVLMTDGVDMGSTLNPSQFWDLLDPSPVRIFTIGLGGELKVVDPAAGISGGHLLRHIAGLSGGRFIYVPSEDELVEVYRKVGEELMSGGTYYLKPEWNRGAGSLLVETEGERVIELVAPPRIELVLDASGSMKKALSGKTRIAVAKEVLKELVEGLPEGVDVALRVYGHRIPEGRKGDCQDTELVYPFERLDKTKLIGRIEGIKSLGTTPIAYSLGQTISDFGESSGEKTVVLVTDGKEECGGDLVATVEELKAQGLDVRLHVVGFTLDDPAVVAQMQQAAEAGRGRYLGAADQGELKEAIAETLAMPYQVLDSSGRVVAKGTAGQSLSLAAGEYEIAAEVPGQDPVRHAVRIDESRTTRVRVTKDGPEVGVQVLPAEAP